MGQNAASADARQHNQDETEMDATTVAVDVAKTVFEVAIANRQSHIVARIDRTDVSYALLGDPVTNASSDGGVWHRSSLRTTYAPSYRLRGDILRLGVYGLRTKGLYSS